MSNINFIKALSYTFDEAKDLYFFFKKKIDDFYKTNGMSFDDLLEYKSRTSSQKFSSWFGEEQKRILGWASFSKNPYDVLDAKDNDLNIEAKYSTYNEKRGASFPQLIRLNYPQPDKYIITIFKESELYIFNVPGADLHNSIIYQTCSLAHASKPDELRNNIKFNTPEMNFLLIYRDAKLEDKLKSANYFLK